MQAKFWQNRAKAYFYTKYKRLKIFTRVREFREPFAEGALIHLHLNRRPVPLARPIERFDLVGGQVERRRRREGNGAGWAQEILGGQLYEGRLHPLIPKRHRFPERERERWAENYPKENATSRRARRNGPPSLSLPPRVAGSRSSQFMGEFLKIKKPTNNF